METQQILRKIELDLRKPTRARHAGGVINHRIQLAGRAYAAKFPNTAPEVLGALHAKVIQFWVADQGDVKAFVYEAHKPRHIRICDPLGGGLPKYLLLSHYQLREDTRQIILRQLKYRLKFADNCDFPANVSLNMGAGLCG